MRKREPQESHKQRFYKLPQVSWSWEATLIVYWGDFSFEKDTVYIFVTRITSQALLEFSSFSTLFVCFFACTPSCKFLWLAVVRSWCVESPSVFNLKSLLQSFLVGWKWCTLHFQNKIGLSRSSLSNRKNTVFSDGVCAYVDPDAGVKLLTRPYFFTNFTGCPCTAWNMLSS